MQNISFCAGVNFKHTHILILSDGRVNQNPDAGIDYPSIDWNTLATEVSKPAISCEKNDGTWFLASAYNKFDARKSDVQKEHGEYHALWTDHDDGDPTFEQVLEFASNAYGDTNFLIYSTRSTGEKREDGSVKRKWRTVAPLEQPIGYLQFRFLQKALNNRMTHYGLTPDRTTENALRIIYRPNQNPSPEPGYEYKGYVNEGPALKTVDTPLAADAARLWGLQNVIDEEARVKALARPAMVNNDPFSYINAFKEEHPVEEFLLQVGFTTNNGIDYHFRGQAGNSFATQLRSDGSIFTLSDTVGKLGGVKTDMGTYFNDHFDIALSFCPTELDKEAFIQTFKDKANEYWVNHGREVYKIFEAEEQARVNHRVEANKEALKTVAEPVIRGSKFTAFEPLKGFTGKVAEYIDQHYMHYDNPEIAAISAIVAVASFAGRKDNFFGAQPVFNCLCLGITGIGKDVVDAFINQVIEDLTQRHAEFQHTNELDVFSPMSMSEGVSSYNEQCAQRLSGTIIMGESGLAKNSTAGDREKVNSLIMSNIAGGAYRAHRKTGQKNALHKVWGVSHSIFEESTFEAYERHLSTNGHETGESARRLFYRVDVSRGNTAGRQRTKHLPTWLLDGFKKLADEALRGEELPMGHVVNDVRYPGTKYTDYNCRVNYACDTQVQKAFDRMDEKTREARKANTDNVADIGWGHKSGRQVLLQAQLCLILARTDCVVNGTQPIVSIDHLLDANMLYRASQATELANSSSFGDPLDDMVNKIMNMFEKFFTKDAPTKSYESHIGYRSPKELFDKQWYPWSLVTTNPTLSKEADKLVNSSYNKKRVWEDIQKLGETNGHWQLEVETRKVFAVVDFAVKNGS